MNSNTESSAIRTATPLGNDAQPTLAGAMRVGTGAITAPMAASFREAKLALLSTAVATDGPGFCLPSFGPQVRR